MLNKHAIAAALALAFALPAHAEFRWELGANYFAGDVDDNNLDADLDVAGVDGSWFFSSVNTDKGPLSEAAFLDRASRVDVLFRDGELDTDFGDLDFSSYGVGSRWVFDRDAGWLVEASFTLDEIDNDETANYRIGGGKYLLENTLVVLSYTYTDPDEGDDIDTYRIEAEHLQPTPIGDLKVEAAYAYADPGDSSDEDIYSGTVTYYPLTQIGVGGRWERTVSGSSSDNWGVFAEWFITENIAVSLEYQDTETTAGFRGVDGDAVIGSALIRF